LRTNHGEDRLSFYLQANAGERSVPVKENASGGELARLLFCLKIALADKNNAPIIIFDEIDANVGGKTADRMGHRLLELGKHKQVLCITHFPQVAKHGDHHFSIIKIGEDGRTITKIERLDEEKKRLELLRMLGEDTISLQNR
jgi:DNA repair protein RecN (Recombination protein N)